MREAQLSRSAPPWVRLWFYIDLILVLMPPVHWVFGTPARILGIPLVLIYLFGSAIVIAASVVAAYLATLPSPAER
jgi:hypothetical protein